MSRAARFWRSAIGKKIVMAVTGIIGIGFLIAHVAGNMAIFRGPEAMNSYSHFLHGPAAELLWATRLVLVLAVILHILAAYQLTQQSRAARPVEYRRREPQVATLADRTMRWGGVLLLAFIIFHILHFTTGTIRPAGVYTEGDVYANVVAGFRVWWVALFYVIAMAFLGLHLYHGAWSSARSLGATGESSNPLRRTASGALAALIWLGFTMIPVAVFFGLVR